jgi:hypothetical protein
MDYAEVIEDCSFCKTCSQWHHLRCNNFLCCYDMSKYDKNAENVESKIGVEMSKNVVSKMSRHFDMSFSKMSRVVEILIITTVVTFI